MASSPSPSTHDTFGPCRCDDEHCIGRVSRRLASVGEYRAYFRSHGQATLADALGEHDDGAVGLMVVSDAILAVVRRGLARVDAAMGVGAKRGRGFNGPDDTALVGRRRQYHARRHLARTELRGPHVLSVGDDVESVPELFHGSGASFEMPRLVGSLGHHCVAIDGLRRVWVWGKGVQGALGLGADHMSDVSLPTLAALPGRALRVVTGQDASYVLLEDYTWWVCGSNAAGSLCLGDCESRPSWTPSPQLTDLGVAQMAVGWNHMVVCSYEGLVYTAGDGASGQLGLKQSDGVWSSSSLVHVASLRKRRITRIAAGSYHNAVCARDGRTWLWGCGMDGQLGIVPPKVQWVPKQPDAFDEDVVDVVCGRRFTVLLTRDGKAFSSGMNKSGQLGQGDVGDNAGMFARVKAPLAAHPIVRIAAGAGHVLTVSSRGALYGWGHDKEGSFGRMEGKDHKYIGEPLRLMTMEQHLRDGCSTILVGDGYTMFHMLDGDVRATGFGKRGQMGTRMCQSRDALRAIQSLPKPMIQLWSGRLVLRPRVLPPRVGFVLQLCRNRVENPLHWLPRDVWRLLLSWCKVPPFVVRSRAVKPSGALPTLLPRKELRRMRASRKAAATLDWTPSAKQPAAEGAASQAWGAHARVTAEAGDGDDGFGAIVLLGSDDEASDPEAQGGGAVYRELAKGFTRAEVGMMDRDDDDILHDARPKRSRGHNQGQRNRADSMFVVEDLDEGDDNEDEDSWDVLSQLDAIARTQARLLDEARAADSPLDPL